MRKTRSVTTPGRRPGFVATLMLLAPAVGIAPAGEPRFIAPTQGRPHFIAPGETLTVVASFPTAESPVTAFLRHPRIASATYPLQVPADARDALKSGRPLRLPIPTSIPPRTYTLVMRAGDATISARNAVAVGPIGDDIRIVHLADMNVGDLGSVEFEKSLIPEVNLLGPTLIVATGDFLDATHPDPARGWAEASDFLAEFDAPVIAACGDHDDAELYSQYLAPSAVGTVDCGPYRFVVLSDHSLARLSDDAAQLQWADDALLKSPAPRSAFVIANSDQPTLLSVWRQRGGLDANVQTARLAASFLGGHCQVSPPGEPAAQSPFVFRTPQASSSFLGGAPGIARFRYVDVRKGRVIVADPQAVGTLRARVSNADDITQTQCTITAASGMSPGIADLGVWVRLKKVDGRQPWARGARFASRADMGEFWECRVTFDLPEKSTVRAVVGSAASAERPEPKVNCEIPSRITFATLDAAQGNGFVSAEGPAPIVTVENPSDQAITCRPLVRLDGDAVPWSAASITDGVVLTAAVDLPPRSTVRLRLDFSAVRVRPGRRALVVYANHDGLLDPRAFEFDAIVAGGRAE